MKVLLSCVFVIIELLTIVHLASALLLPDLTNRMTCCCQCRMLTCVATDLAAGRQSDPSLEPVPAREGAAGDCEQAGSHRASTGSPVHLHGLCDTAEEPCGVHALWSYLLLWLLDESQGRRRACVYRMQQSADYWVCGQPSSGGTGD